MKKQNSPHLENIADLLWLSQFTGMQSVVAEKIEDNKQKKPKPENQIEDDEVEEDYNSSEPEMKEPEDDLEVHADNQDDKNSSQTKQKKAKAIQSPKRLALSNYREWEKAFKFINLKQPSRNRYELDEEKTVENIASSNVFDLVFKQVQEKRFFLTIVIDRGETMKLWDELIKNFEQMLLTMGVFARVSIYYWDTKDKKPKLYADRELKREVSEKLVIMDGKRNLVWILSDCIAPSWKSSEAFKSIERWSEKSFTSILQMFPKEMWMGTMLFKGKHVRLSATSFNSSNKKLKVKSPIKEKNSLNVPVISFDPYALQAWAKVVVNAKNNSISGIALENIDFPPVEGVSKKEITPDMRMQRFYSQASPTAQKLAFYMSVLPVDFKVTRILQEERLPKSNQAHVAEVFLGGLIERTKKENNVHYDFYPKIREELNANISADDSFKIMEDMSNFVSRHLGIGFDFKALLTDPNGAFEGEVELSSESLAYARLASRVLKRKGGKLYDIAKSIDEKILKFNKKENIVKKYLRILEKLTSKKEGFIRYYNLNVYKNNEGKMLVSNRRNAGVLLVEPKVKSLTRGKLTITQSHDEISLIVQQGAKEQKYNIRKNDVAKTNELAGVGGKVDGKLFIPFKNGEIIEEGDSIIEVIKEAWSVPSRIPFASELKVEDGEPITQDIHADAKGTVKFFLLKGDYLERLENVQQGKAISEKGLFAVVVDDNNREAARHYVARGSIVNVDDNTLVTRGDVLAKTATSEQVVIAEWDPYSEPMIAEANGRLKFEDIIPGVTVVEQFDELTGESRLTLNEYIPTSYNPAIVLATDDDEIITYALNPKTSIFVKDGQKVGIADILTKVPKNPVLKERDIIQSIIFKLQNNGWKKSNIIEEYQLLDRYRIDLLLMHDTKKVGLIEVKLTKYEAKAGLKQAILYGKKLNIDYAYSTNGLEIYEYSLKNGVGKYVDEFPSPEELLERYVENVTIEHKEFERINLTRLMMEKCEEYELLAHSKNRNFIYHFGISDFKIKLEAFFFMQVFENLIKNSFQFTPKNGLISLSTHVNAHNFTIEIRDEAKLIDETKDSFSEWEYSSELMNTNSRLFIVKKAAEEIGVTVSLQNSEDESGRIAKIEFPLNKFLF